MSDKYVFPIEAYKQGWEECEQHIIKLIEDNRTEVTDGVYRDHFESESLIALIKEGKE